MDEHNYRNNDAWDEGIYGTGNTEPPKNRGGVTAILLILIIFLCGIVTVLGILNIRLFKQLNQQEDTSLALAIVDPLIAEQETLPQITLPEEPAEETHPIQEELRLDLHTAPSALENFPREGGLSLQEIYLKNIPSVVSITSNLHGGSSTGTGVILSDNGYVVTNAHVVKDSVTITVQLTDDRVFQARLVGSDDVTDLAVLDIDGSNFISAEFGDSETLRVGDTVTAIGDPLGVEFRGTFTDGIVSAINRDITVDGRTMTLIQTNAALNSGNSGGPLINCYGQVIGINTMKIGAFTDSAGVEGLGFAIPSATVKDIVGQIITQGYVSGRPTLNIQGEALGTFYQYYYRMPPGLYITYVKPASYADFYGIQPGDLLLSIDDNPILSMEDLNAVLYSHEVGDVVCVTIYRAGKKASIDLTLTEDRG